MTASPGLRCGVTAAAAMVAWLVVAGPPATFALMPPGGPGLMHRAQQQRRHHQPAAPAPAAAGGLRAAAEVARAEGLMARCSVRFRAATVDHFSWAPPPGNTTTFSQRYFVCAEDGWAAPANGARGPIFFYAGE